MMKWLDYLIIKYLILWNYIYIETNNMEFANIIKQTKEINKDFIGNPSSERDEDFIIAFAYILINANKANKVHFKTVNALTRNDYVLELQNTKEHFNRVMNRIINSNAKLLDVINQEENCLENKNKEELIEIIRKLNPAAK